MLGGAHLNTSRLGRCVKGSLSDKEQANEHLGRCVKGSLSDKEQVNVYVLQEMKAEVD